MNFAPYQSRGQLEAPYQHYTKPANLQVDNSGQKMLARANADTANVIVAGFNNWREQYDQGKVMEANNEYNRLMSEGTAELMQKKQENALNVVEDYDKLHVKALEKVRKKYGQFINYGKAGQAFTIYTERDNNTRREHMMKYQMAETDAYHETQFNNQLATCIQTAADGGYTDMSIDQGLNRAEGFIEAWYGQYGKEMVEQQKRIFKGQIVGNALQLAVNMGDYARMNTLCDKYSKIIDPKTLVTVKGLMMKRNREEKELSFHQQMMKDLGPRPSNDEVKQYLADNWSRLHPPEGNYKGDNAEAWKEAQWVESQTGLKAEWIYRQWAHESAYFSSDLARLNKNFGGLTQVEPNGEDNHQPDGGNYYREFNSFHEYAEAYVNDFIRYYEGRENVKTLHDFVYWLSDNDYFTADPKDYLSSVENIDMELEEGSVEQSEPSGVEFENEYQEALKFRDNQLHLVEAENRRLIKAADTDIKEMVLRGDISGIDNLPIKFAYNPDGSVNRDVMINIQTMVEAEKTRQQKAVEQAAKGQPSSKVTQEHKDFVYKMLVSGKWTSEADIDEYCNDVGITSEEQRNKLQKIFSDRKENKGFWAVDTEQLYPYLKDLREQFSKESDFKDEADKAIRMEYNLLLAENKGRLPDGWEALLATRIKDKASKIVSYEYKKPGDWGTSRREYSGMDLYAAGILTIWKPSEADMYVVNFTDKPPRYMSGDELDILLEERSKANQ